MSDTPISDYLVYLLQELSERKLLDPDAMYPAPMSAETRQKWYDEIKAGILRLERELAAREKELGKERARMCAWMDAFKTTQLSHAVERLERAEAEVTRLQHQNATIAQRILAAHGNPPAIQLQYTEPSRQEAEEGET